MGPRPILLAAAALALSGCASSQYGYAYCYDPYLGPVGYHYGPFEKPPVCATNAAALAQAAYYVGPYENGYRAPYVTGPYFATPASARSADGGAR